MSIRSDPAGADVFLDGERIGQTPCEVPFTHYGKRALLLERDGYQADRRILSVSAPLYQYFPLDFISDLLIPFTITDHQQFDIQLTKLEEGQSVKDLMNRADALKKRAEDTHQNQDQNKKQESK